MPCTFFVNLMHRKSSYMWGGAYFTMYNFCVFLLPSMWIKNTDSQIKKLLVSCYRMHIIVDKHINKINVYSTIAKGLLNIFA